MTMKLLQENENNSKAKLYRNHWTIHLSFHYLFFASKVILYFSIIVYPLIECVLFKKEGQKNY